MRSLRPWLLIAILPWLAGCPTIYSDQPLGDEVAVLDPAAIDGFWLAGDYLFGVRVVDAQKGRLIYWGAANFRKSTPDATVQCEPPQHIDSSCYTDKSHSDTGTCTLRHHHQKFAIGSERSVDADLYFPEERRPDESVYATTMVWLGDLKSEVGSSIVVRIWQDDLHRRLKELVQKGALPGRIESSGRVVLGALKPEHYDVLFSQESGIIDWRPPSLVFMKLPPQLDPCKKRENPK